MSDKLKIYVGYDSREDIAWQVCRHSILRHSTPDLEVHPLKLAALQELGLYTREADNAATEFSLTRFLTPYLAAHDGWTIFVDCDFLFTNDIRNVLTHANRTKAIYVVKHEYTPANTVKMDGKTQTYYPRKNWSSFILFNSAHPDVKRLTPDVVNTSAPSFLHRFQWVSDDELIGALPIEWNFLEGEYPKPATLPAAIHYTNGGPWFENWQNVDFADIWCAERDRYLAEIRT
ncbi:glycosyltransferase [Aquibium sp. LZ166]|uniref:Glycosyltransferase n=1 Tax=Aquibium pacificus TaxID=3153579 RepID=A0ABV3STU6_9HYPH